MKSEDLKYRNPFRLLSEQGIPVPYVFSYEEFTKQLEQYFESNLTVNFYSHSITKDAAFKILSEIEDDQLFELELKVYNNPTLLDFLETGDMRLFKTPQPELSQLAKHRLSIFFINTLSSQLYDKFKNGEELTTISAHQLQLYLTNTDTIRLFEPIKTSLTKDLNKLKGALNQTGEKLRASIEFHKHQFDNLLYQQLKVLPNYFDHIIKEFLLSVTKLAALERFAYANHNNSFLLDIVKNLSKNEDEADNYIALYNKHLQDLGSKKPTEKQPLIQAGQIESSDLSNTNPLKVLALILLIIIGVAKGFKSCSNMNKSTSETDWNSNHIDMSEEYGLENFYYSTLDSVDSENEIESLIHELTFSEPSPNYDSIDFYMYENFEDKSGFKKDDLTFITLENATDYDGVFFLRSNSTLSPIPHEYNLFIASMDSAQFFFNRSNEIHILGYHGNQYNIDSMVIEGQKMIIEFEEGIPTLSAPIGVFKSKEQLSRLNTNDEFIALGDTINIIIDNRRLFAVDSL